MQFLYVVYSEHYTPYTIHCKLYSIKYIMYIFNISTQTV